MQLAIKINRVFVCKHKTVFVYDKYHQAWFELVPHQDQGTATSPWRFIRLHAPPLLDKSSAVVGSRTLDDRTAKEIVGLFLRTVDEERRHRDNMAALTEQMHAFHVTPQWEWVEGGGWVRKKVTPGDTEPMHVGR